MRARTIVLVLAAWLASLSGCAGTAPSRFYGLRTIPASESGTFEEPRSFTVGVTRLTLPDFLDRPQIATRLSPNEIRYDEFNRWAEPLKDNISRVLAENLSVLLGPDRVLVSPRAAVLSPDYQVWVDVIQFDADPGGDFSLGAQWSLYRNEEKKVLVRKRFSVLEQADAPGYGGMTAAGSRAVAGLSRDIAKAIRAVHEEPGLFDPGQDGATSRF